MLWLTGVIMHFIDIMADLVMKRSGLFFLFVALCLV